MRKSKPKTDSVQEMLDERRDKAKEVFAGDPKRIAIQYDKEGITFINCATKLGIYIQYGLFDVVRMVKE